MIRLVFMSVLKPHEILENELILYISLNIASMFLVEIVKENDEHVSLAEDKSVL